MSINTVVGIDLSMTCPAMCVHTGETWQLSNCKFFYLTSRKKSIIHIDQFTGELHSDFNSPEERFDSITKFLIDNIPVKATVAIEGYSFASTGSRIFQIGELCGVLKHKLYRFGFDFITPPPSKIKKLASNFGNASKIQMDTAFQRETGIDISKIVNCGIGDSPSSDVIDSFYLAKCVFLYCNHR